MATAAIDNGKVDSAGLGLLQGSGMTFSLAIRLDRPVAECEMIANAFLSTKGGALDNQARAKYMEANPHSFVYKWFRGPQRSYCCSNVCPRVRSGSLEPSKWSKASCASLSYICGVCQRAGVLKFDATFCSLTCFKEGWRHHVGQKHTNLKFAVNGASSSDPAHQDSLDIVSTPTTVVATTTSANDGNSSSNNSSSNSNSNSNSNNSNSSNSRTLALETSHNEDKMLAWDLVCTDKQYTPSAQDIGCVFKVEVAAVSTNSSRAVLAGPFIMYSEPVMAPPKGPPRRHLMSVSGALNGVTRLSNFRVISYNILADLYANRQQYPHCDAWNLTWPFRRRMIFQELSDVQGDIVCLQEVQSDHYEQHLLPFMESLGYDGMYKMKSRDGGGVFAKVDGCATFWRRSKFAVVENYVIDFNESARRNATSMNLDEVESRKYISRLSKDNIAQVLFLEILTPAGASSGNLGPTGSGPLAGAGGSNGSRLSRSNSGNGLGGIGGANNYLYVVNTHLYSNPRNPEVKLWQTLTLIGELEQILQNRGYADAPVMICGDFNSEPDSAVYEFLSEGMISRHRPEIEESDNLRILPDLHQVGHGLGLQSMMKCALASEPVFTNYTSQFKGTLDYIWFTASRLRILAVNSMPDEKDLTADNPDGGLPNTSYPSDHLMLCSDIALIANPTYVHGAPSNSRELRELRNLSRGGSGNNSNSNSSSGIGMMSRSNSYGGMNSHHHPSSSMGFNGNFNGGGGMNMNMNGGPSAGGGMGGFFYSGSSSNNSSSNNNSISNISGNNSNNSHGSSHSSSSRERGGLVRSNSSGSNVGGGYGNSNSSSSGYTTGHGNNSRMNR